MHSRTMKAMVGVVLTAALLLSGCTVAEDGTIIFSTPFPIEDPTEDMVEEDEPTPTAEPTETGSAEEGEPEQVIATVNADSLRVRQEPTTDSPIVAGLRQGDEVAVNTRNAESTWVQIQIPDVDTAGWVATEFITLSAGVESLPEAVETPVETPPTETDAETDAETEAEATPTSEPTEDEEVGEESSPEDAEEPTEEPAAEAATPQIDIVDTARAIDEFSSLTAAWEAANLVEALEAEGPFTVFAPTDSAFNALPDNALDTMMAEPADALTQLLLFHVIPQRVPAADIADGSEMSTLQGESLSFTVDGDVITVNGSNVILTDIETSNGVIHVIDTVLLPTAVDLSSDETEQEQTATATPESPEETDGEADEEVDEEVDEETDETADEETPEATPEAPAEEPEPEEDTSTALTLPPTDRLAEINTRSLRVREAPNTDSEVLWGARMGEFYPVLDESDDGAWASIAMPELEDGTGWVSTEFISITENITVIPTLGTATVVTTEGDRLRVRNEPTEETELVSNLNAGEQHEIVAVTEDGVWALLNLEYDQGPVPGPSWVAREFLEIQ